MAQKSELPPIDRREEVRVDQEPGYVRKQRVIRDAGAERRQTLNRVNQVVWLIFGVIIGLIAFRVVLRLIVANPANTFADFIYSVTDLFLRPFYGLVGTPTTT
ncbi:MAG: YggT family protein, partial [Anaerolineae bacterium]|nr:YggT family protein [Anaerolineae bacterium]